jgi:hypothetical protein
VVLGTVALGEAYVRLRLLPGNGRLADALRTPGAAAGLGLLLLLVTAGGHRRDGGRGRTLDRLVTAESALLLVTAVLVGAIGATSVVTSAAVGALALGVALTVLVGTLGRELHRLGG